MENTDRFFRIRFDYKSFLIFIGIFFIEVCIALFVDDKIIRPYGGDFLVVIMIYYFLKAFVATNTKFLLISVLLFAYTVEILQLFNMVSVLGVENNKVLSTILGTAFSWGDFIAYTLGIAFCWLIEIGFKRNEKT